MSDRGRPKKYKVTQRYLITLDADLVKAFDILIEDSNGVKNRSEAINDLITQYVRDKA